MAQGDQVDALRPPGWVGWRGWEGDTGRVDMGIYICMQLIHFVVQQKLHNTVKQLYSNKDVKKKRKPSHTHKISTCFQLHRLQELWHITLN